MLGITVVVSKERRLFFSKGVRIHLDRVDRLGNFIEFEGLAADGEDIKHFEDPLTDLRQAFGVRDEDLVGGSYSDQLGRKEPGSNHRRDLAL